MAKSSAALLLFLVVATTTRAEWKIVSAQTEPSAAAGLEHHHLVLQDRSTGGAATIDIALFDSARCTLRVVDNPNGTQSLADAMRGDCLAGVNGGYFDPNFAPIGLRVIGGKTIVRLVRARLLSGVLSASPHGVEIVRVAEFSRKRPSDAAMECGPFLVDLGAKVRGLDDKREARRTFAAVARGGRVAIGICSEISLAQLAALLAEASLSNDFKIWRALNLDGGSSSAFWFADRGKTFSISEQKTVRDFVAIVSR